MNAPFSWNAGVAKMRCRTSSSLALDAEPLGLGERRLLIDQLLEDLLVDAELLQELFADVAAVGVAIRLQLGVVAAAEIRPR